jgi:hypothetical protein
VPAEDDVIHRFLRLEHGLALLALAAAGCGAAESNNSSDQALLAQVNGTAPASTGDAPKASESAPSSDAKQEDLSDPQKEQMEIALRRGGDKSANCFRVVDGAVAGEGEVKVTFDGKKGRAVDVAVGAPWAGTAVESCIKRSFIGEIIVPFEGQLEVPYTVKLGAKADPSKGKPKDPKKK